MRTSSLKNFDFATRTHKGLVREVNEDFLAYFDTINGQVFVLCDGMGGHSAGDVAAEMATESVGVFFSQAYHKNPFDAVEKAILTANKEVLMHALGNDYLHGMGTTIVLILIRDDRVFYAHAGDSRLYVFRNRKLKQLTKDHSYVQSLLDKGLISEKEALTHPRRNEVLNAVGLPDDFKPDVSPQAFIPHNDDILMLCSDGLTNMLKDNEIEAILKSKYRLNDKASKLIKQANNKGGLDNISLQLIKFHNLSKDENIGEQKVKRSIFNNKKIGYVIASTILIILSFFVGLLENKDSHITRNKNISTIRPSSLTEIFAYSPQKNETWESIAYKFNCNAQCLKKLNPNVRKLDSKIHIKLPIKASVLVKQTGDIYLLAHKYDCNVIDIMKANELNSIYLKIGSNIIIPVNSKK